MITSYKYLKFVDGVFLIFEKGMKFKGKEMPIDLVEQSGVFYLRIGETHFVFLEPDIIGHLIKTKKLYISVSNVFDTKIEMQGAIELDDISLGKLMAYMEMGTTNPLTLGRM